MATSNNLKRRRRIIDAANQILQDGGIFNRFTLAKVAEKAGVSKGGLLHHFPSKDALLTGISKDSIDRFTIRLEERFKSKPAEPGRFLETYIETTLEDKEAFGDMNPILLAFLRAASGEETPSRFNKWQESIQKDGLDYISATVIRLATDGLAYAEVIDGQKIDQELREKILDKLMQMAKTAQ